jgi:hypothetical protein
MRHSIADFLHEEGRKEEQVQSQQDVLLMQLRERPEGRRAHDPRHRRRRATHHPAAARAFLRTRSMRSGPR